MKLGVFTCLLQNLPLEEALKYFKSLGIEMIELGCGGFPGNAHCDGNQCAELSRQSRSSR